MAHLSVTRVHRSPARTAGGGAGGGPPSRRWVVFVHQDGVLLCTTLRGLASLGILERSLVEERPLERLYPDLTPDGFAHMRVGLRCLASQGWLEAAPTLDPGTTWLRWTDAGRSAMRYLHLYVAGGDFLAQFPGSHRKAWAEPWDQARIESLLDLVPVASQRWLLDDGLSSDLRALITTHLDAAVVVPVMLWLHSTARLTEEAPLLPEGDLGDGILRLLRGLGWIGNGGLSWTPSGRAAAGLAVHFGMAASYLPLLSRLPELYRGHAQFDPVNGCAEGHVNRELNVIASGAAHARYFADADRVFLELFNREPVAAQPRFIADMGCGDGSWLVHLYRLITERTLRGACSAEEPLLMVGLDYNLAALEEAERTLTAAGVPALLLPADISDPSGVRSMLGKHGLAMEDGLHIRAFIDHNRSYGGDISEAHAAGVSSGAYLDREGRALDPAWVERDLVEHLRRWAPHVHKHGLVMLEAHCVAPEIARRHLGATHAVAFDAYHGYSRQYPIEHSVFLRCCMQAGLRPASHCERRYPASRPFVAVSLNRLITTQSDTQLPAFDPVAIRHDTWQPARDVDLQDGRALHALLYTDADIRHPRQWCSAATGSVVAETLEAVEERLATIREGDTIRVLDYGAGTGLATIELLKACREVGIERRLERLKANLEVYLVDLPSSWFAQGFELLRHCSWTSFHSLRAPGGGFRSLLEVTGGALMDAVMSNMVFHLIPPAALPRATAELASVTRRGGRLVWNSPDLGPPGRYAVLFHDANRQLRRRWLTLLRSQETRPAGSNGNGTHRHHDGHSDALEEAVRRTHRVLDASGMREAQARADRRVLPSANSASAVSDALTASFGGNASLTYQTHEILNEDLLDTLLVPSNQEEYLPEIPDRALREEVIRELMLHDVLPAMRDEAAGTALGLNVQWTLGQARRAVG